jgi:hypothetical protein
MKLEDQIERAVALLAAAMKKSGIRRASGFVQSPPTTDAEARLKEVLASAETQPNPEAAKRAAA